MVSKKDAIIELQSLLGGDPILIVGLGDDLPTIHNFYPIEKYYKTIKHRGFGIFEGETEHGLFSFDAGGAMQEIVLDEPDKNDWGGKTIAWCYLYVDNDDVLKDLGYNHDKVMATLQKKLEGCEKNG